MIWPLKKYFNQILSPINYFLTLFKALIQGGRSLDVAPLRDTL